MGQKVNPIAVRQNFNRFSDSSWFSDYYYSTLFYQDLNLRQYLNNIKQPSANKLGFRVAKCVVHHFPKRSLIHLFSLSDSSFSSRKIRRCTPAMQNSFGTLTTAVPHSTHLKDGSQRKNRQNFSQLPTSWRHSPMLQKKKALVNFHRKVADNLPSPHSQRPASGFSAFCGDFRDFRDFRFLRAAPFGFLLDSGWFQWLESRWNPGNTRGRLALEGRISSDSAIPIDAKSALHSRPSNHVNSHNKVEARSSAGANLNYVRAALAGQDVSSLFTPPNTGNSFFHLYAMHYFFMQKTNTFNATRIFPQTRNNEIEPRCQHASKIGLYSRVTGLVSNTARRLRTNKYDNTGTIWPKRPNDFSLSNIHAVLSLATNTSILLRPIKVNSVFQSASMLAQEVACKLEQKKSFRLICRLIFQQRPDAASNYIKGIRITCSGRINGAEIAKTECRKFGETSLHVFSDKIDYARTQAFTPYGILGVKVWISYI